MPFDPGERKVECAAQIAGGLPGSGNAIRRRRPPLLPRLDEAADRHLALGDHYPSVGGAAGSQERESDGAGLQGPTGSAPRLRPPDLMAGSNQPSPGFLAREGDRTQVIDPSFHSGSDGEAFNETQRDRRTDAPVGGFPEATFRKSLRLFSQSPSCPREPSSRRRTDRVVLSRWDSNRRDPYPPSRRAAACRDAGHASRLPVS